MPLSLTVIAMALDTLIINFKSCFLNQQLDLNAKATLYKWKTNIFVCPTTKTLSQKTRVINSKYKLREDTALNSSVHTTSLIATVGAVSLASPQTSKLLTNTVGTSNQANNVPQPKHLYATEFAPYSAALPFKALMENLIWRQESSFTGEFIYPWVLNTDMVKILRRNWKELLCFCASKTLTLSLTLISPLQH